MENRKGIHRPMAAIHFLKILAALSIVALLAMHIAQGTSLFSFLAIPPKAEAATIEHAGCSGNGCWFTVVHPQGEIAMSDYEITVAPLDGRFHVSNLGYDLRKIDEPWGPMQNTFTCGIQGNGFLCRGLTADGTFALTDFSILGPCGSPVSVRITFGAHQYRYAKGDRIITMSPTVIDLTATTPACPLHTPQCSDGADNDSDGIADHGVANVTAGDFSCWSPDDNDETNPKSECQDGLDNDGDGKSDFPADPGCRSPQDHVERDLLCPGGAVPQALSEQVLSTPQFPGDPSTRSLSLDQGTYFVEYNEGGWSSTPGQWFGLFTASYQSPTGPVTAQIGSTTAFPTQMAARNNANGRFEIIELTTGNLTLSLPGGNEGRLSAFVYRCPQSPLPQCRDGIDNDRDGKVDFPQDPGCTSNQDNDEFDAQCTPEGSPTLHVVGHLPTGRFANSCAVDSSTHKIYCFGGNPLTNTIVDFNPATNASVTKGAVLPQAAAAMGCAENSLTHKIYCFGGGDGATVRTDTRIVEYTPATDTLRTMNAALPSGRYGLSCAENSLTHKIYCFGGTLAVDTNTSQILEYDPATDSLNVKSATTPTFSRGRSCVENRTTHTIFCFGADDARQQYPTYPGGFLKEIIEYSPQSDTVTHRGQLPQSASFMGCAQDNAGDFYCFGGISHAGDLYPVPYDNTTGGGYIYYDRILRYTPGNQQIITLGLTLQPGRGLHNACVFDALSQCIYCLGGNPNAPGALDQIVRLCPNRCRAVPQCRDGIDNDRDEKVDCTDPGCHTDGNAQNLSSCDPNDNDETDRTPGGPNLDIRKEIIGKAVKGQEVTFRITATNIGNAPADHAVIVDKFPKELTFVSGKLIPQGKPCSLELPGTIHEHVLCPVGTLQPGSEQVAELVFRVSKDLPCGQQLMNEADVNAAGGVTDWSKIPVTVSCENQGGSSSTWSSSSSSAGQGPARLEVDQTAPTTVQREGVIVFEITGKNVGVEAAEAVKISSTKGGNLSFVAGQSTFGCVDHGSHIGCDVGNLGGGMSKIVQVAYRAGGPCSAQIHSTAVAQGAGGLHSEEDTDVAQVWCETGSSSSSASSSSLGSSVSSSSFVSSSSSSHSSSSSSVSSSSSASGPHLSIDIEGATSFQKGQPLSVTITAKNTGAEVHGAVVNLHGIEGLSLVSSTGNACSEHPNHVHCELKKGTPDQGKIGGGDGPQVIALTFESKTCGAAKTIRAYLEASDGLVTVDEIATFVSCP